MESSDDRFLWVLFIGAVVCLFFAWWFGAHDPHSGLCNEKLFNVTCGRMITMSEQVFGVP